MALSVADYDVLLNATLTLANMQERLSQNALTQSRMRKLLGMVSCSEKLKYLRPLNAYKLGTNTQKPSAKNAHTFYLDDTTNRTLNKVPIEKTRNGKTLWRSGVYTSACLALLVENRVKTVLQLLDAEPESDVTRRVVLFQSNIDHADVWLDEVLSRRDPDLPAPLLMSDALSSNHVTAVPFNKALCNAHARRSMAELIDTYPDEALFALET